MLDDKRSSYDPIFRKGQTDNRHHFENFLKLQRSIIILIKTIQHCSYT